MPNKEWKRSERKIALMLGGTRVPVTGRGGNPDIDHEVLAIEHKYGQRILSSRLKKALEQADLAGGKTGKIPIVTFEESSGGKGENLKGVLIEMKAFVYLLNFLMKPVIDKIEEEDIRGNDDNARSTTPTE